MSKKLLEYIFSIKNDDGRKVWTILGLKIRIKNRSALSKNTKQLILSTINDPDFFDLHREVYYFYEESKARKLYPIFKCRITKEKIIQTIEKYSKKFKRDVYILSDMDKREFPPKCKMIKKEDIPSFSNKDCLIILAYNKDFEALEVANLLSENNIKYFSLSQFYPHARYFHTDKIAYETLEDEFANNGEKFAPVDFENIFQAINNCKNLEGDYVEIGTYKGDSASAVLNYMKRAKIDKKAYFFDTFVGFNYDEAHKSQDGRWANSHKDTSLEQVREKLANYENARVVQNNIITDQFPDEIKSICVANIDVDMYDAVKAALYKVKDLIVKNGIIIAEDYGHTPALLGAQKATKEFLQENPDLFIPIYLNSGQLFLIRK